MIGSLVRWFGGGRSGSSSARRFTPCLEALETRALPSGFSGAVMPVPAAPVGLPGANVSHPPHVTQTSGQTAGDGAGVLLGFSPSVTGSKGEEIPQ